MPRSLLRFASICAHRCSNKRPLCSPSSLTLLTTPGVSYTSRASGILRGDLGRECATIQILPRQNLSASAAGVARPLKVLNPLCGVNWRELVARHLACEGRWAAPQSLCQSRINSPLRCLRCMCPGLTRTEQGKDNKPRDGRCSLRGCPACPRAPVAVAGKHSGAGDSSFCGRRQRNARNRDGKLAVGGQLDGLYLRHVGTAIRETVQRHGQRAE